MYSIIPCSFTIHTMPHRVALQLELDEVTERLDQGFDEDRAAGKLARLPEIIRAARAALRQRSAS